MAAHKEMDPLSIFLHGRQLLLLPADFPNVPQTTSEKGKHPCFEWKEFAFPFKADPFDNRW